MERLNQFKREIEASGLTDEQDKARLIYVGERIIEMERTIKLQRWLIGITFAVWILSECLLAIIF